MYIAYIYDKENNNIAQIHEVMSVSVSLKLSSVSTAQFVVFHDSEYCNRQYLKEYRRVKLTLKAEDHTEKELFDGVIRGFDITMTGVSVKLESFEHLLDRRILLSNYNFDGMMVKTMIEHTLNEVNTRYDTGITLDCDVVDTTTKKFEKGISMLDVLEELAKNGYEFRIIDKVLIFKQSIGIDRTTGNGMVQYKYDVFSPDERTIDGIKMQIDGKDLTNGALSKVKENSQYIDDDTSIEEFGLLETAFSKSGDENTTAQSYINEHKDTLFEIDVDVVSKDFFEGDLGDMVKVDIVSGNDLLFYDGTMKILEKSYTGGDLPSIEIKVGKVVVPNKDIFDQVSTLKRRVQFLEINQ